MPRHPNGRRNEQINATVQFVLLVFLEVQKKIGNKFPTFLDLLKKVISPHDLSVEQIVDSIVGAGKDVKTLSGFAVARMKEEMENHTTYEMVVNTRVKVSHIFAGTNYAVFTGNSLLKLAHKLRKCNLKDPAFILEFSGEIVALLTYVYNILAHVDGVYEVKPRFSKNQFLFDIFIFTLTLTIDVGLRIAYRNFFTGGGVYARQAVARAVQLGLPDRMRGLFMIPFSLLKSGMGKFRQPKSLIISGPLSIPKVSVVLKEKTNKFFFSRLKKIALNVRPTLTESIKDNFSYMLNKKSEINPIAIFAVQNYKIPVPSLKVDFVHFMIKNYKTIHVEFPLAKVAPIIKDVVVQPITSYKLRLVSPVVKFQTFKSYLNPFTLTWF